MITRNQPGPRTVDARLSPRYQILFTLPERAASSHLFCSHLHCISGTRKQLVRLSHAQRNRIEGSCTRLPAVGTRTTFGYFGSVNMRYSALIHQIGLYLETAPGVSSLPSQHGKQSSTARRRRPCASDYGPTQLRVLTSRSTG